ncbi:hypothetical protein QA596_02785 [Balneolales bacterium ANBcel1]|nr:hypothetical protein [Balneolales bacterium ANBcel1]
MSHEQKKIRAFELVTPVVDDEASEEEKKFFFDFLETDEDVRRYFEEEQLIKKLVKRHGRYHSAPPALRKKISSTITHLAGQERLFSDDGLFVPFSIRRTPDIRRIAAIAVAASVLLSILLYLFLLLNGTSSEQVMAEHDRPSVEWMAYHHYETTRGMSLQPDIPPLPSDEMSSLLAEHFNYRIDIPRINGARLAGVVDTEFVPELRTPLFVYEMGPDDIIYVFALPETDLEQRLVRDPDAVAHCVTRGDYFVSTMRNRDLVSWKWNETWYVGISRHDGETLAALLPE